MANRTALEIFSSREEVKGIVAETFNSWLHEIGMKSIAMAITNIADIADTSPEGKGTKGTTGVRGYFKVRVVLPSHYPLWLLSPHLK